MLLKEDISIVICGEAGQGIQTIESLLVGVFKKACFNIVATKEYMSRVRGGSNSTEIRVSSYKKQSYLKRIDLLVALDKDAIPHLADRISANTVIFGEKKGLQTDKEVVNIPFSEIAAEEGSAIFANTAAAGLILSLFKIDQQLLTEHLNKLFASKGEDIVRKNISSAGKGFALGKKLLDSREIEIELKPELSVKDDIVISGAQAIALGAAAGGCDFVSAYPMTPSTGILTNLSKYSKELGLITEQAEDEISAANMAIGAWYAGSRGFVVTAGGGFALMAEALSLSGMIESPLVVSLGQRPAPATGLPTRTEQGDLEQALYSGHGEFPRVIFSPGTVEEAFYVTQKAFNIADKYQIPVIILSDQYLVDLYYNTPMLNPSGIPVDKYVAVTDELYKRYSLNVNGDGVSPRGIPGNGKGLVRADSDEHDEDGRITEDPLMRKRMVEKRLKKQDYIKRGVMPPEFYGPADYETLVIGWGSTFGSIKEALGNIADKKTAYLHFKQVYPLHSFTTSYLKKAKKTIIIENNATSQFGKIIKLNTGFDIDHAILKYDGMPFSVEGLTAELKAIAG